MAWSPPRMPTLFVPIYCIYLKAISLVNSILRFCDENKRIRAPFVLHSANSRAPLSIDAEEPNFPPILTQFFLSTIY